MLKPCGSYIRTVELKLEKGDEIALERGQLFYYKLTMES
jgi:hypothetical protein